LAADKAGFWSLLLPRAEPVRSAADGGAFDRLAPDAGRVFGEHFTDPPSKKHQAHATPHLLRLLVSHFLLSSQLPRIVGPNASHKTRQCRSR
jgi:hypothetical protein